MNNYRIVEGGFESGVTVYRIQQRSFCFLKNIVNYFKQQPFEFKWKFVTCPYYNDPVEFTSLTSAQRTMKQLLINKESKYWQWVPITCNLKTEKKQHDLF